MKPEGRALRGLVLAVVLLGLVLPILAGGFETVRAAFGMHAVLTTQVEWQLPWQKLWALPGFGTSVRLSLATGLGSTVIALILAVALCAQIHGSRFEARASRLLTPILAVPHAALAIGLGFLIAPAGWISRVLASVLGWASPPEIALVNDPAGLALLLGLVVKELPFLLLVMLAGLRQLPVRGHLAAGQSLGYGRAGVWIKVILPQLWPLIRLPVLVVQAYALSAVDMAMILGPANPPTLAVAVTRWFGDPDLAMVFPASAGAMLIAALVGVAVLAWLGLEALAAGLGRIWLRRGARGRVWGAVLSAGAGGAMAALGLGLAALITLVIWSFAARWSFPQPLPESWTFKTWSQPAMGWGRAAGMSLVLGLVTTALATLLAVAWLEAEDRGGMRRAGWAVALIYLPLLLPQIAFLYGLNLLFLRLGLSGGIVAVIWAQSLFVFPYVMIALSDPWRALDPALIRTAASLGAGANRRLFAVKLPCLLAPLLTAAAIGFAVSIAQYLPTLFMGAGRIATLTTEAVTLSSGSDRRVSATYGVLQAALPFAGYALALLLPRLAFRHRRALQGAV